MSMGLINALRELFTYKHFDKQVEQIEEPKNMAEVIQNIKLTDEQRLKLKGHYDSQKISQLAMWAWFREPYTEEQTKLVVENWDNFTLKLHERCVNRDVVGNQIDKKEFMKGLREFKKNSSNSTINSQIDLFNYSSCGVIKEISNVIISNVIPMNDFEKILNLNDEKLFWEIYYNIIIFQKLILLNKKKLEIVKTYSKTCLKIKERNPNGFKDPAFMYFNNTVKEINAGNIDLNLIIKIFSNIPPKKIHWFLYASNYFEKLLINKKIDSEKLVLFFKQLFTDCFDYEFDFGEVYFKPAFDLFGEKIINLSYSSITNLNLKNLYKEIKDENCQKFSTYLSTKLKEREFIDFFSSFTSIDLFTHIVKKEISVETLIDICEKVHDSKHISSVLYFTCTCLNKNKNFTEKEIQLFMEEIIIRTYFEKKEKSIFPQTQIIKSFCENFFIDANNFTLFFLLKITKKFNTQEMDLHIIKSENIFTNDEFIEYLNEIRKSNDKLNLVEKVLIYLLKNKNLNLRPKTTILFLKLFENKKIDLEILEKLLDNLIKKFSNDKNFLLGLLSNKLLYAVIKLVEEDVISLKEGEDFLIKLSDFEKESLESLFDNVVPKIFSLLKNKTISFKDAEQFLILICRKFPANLKRISIIILNVLSEIKNSEDLGLLWYHLNKFSILTKEEFIDFKKMTPEQREAHLKNHIDTYAAIVLGQDTSYGKENMKYIFHAINSSNLNYNEMESTLNKYTEEVNKLKPTEFKTFSFKIRSVKEVKLANLLNEKLFNYYKTLFTEIISTKNIEELNLNALFDDKTKYDKVILGVKYSQEIAWRVVLWKTYQHLGQDMKDKLTKFTNKNNDFESFNSSLNEFRDLYNCVRELFNDTVKDNLPKLDKEIHKKFMQYHRSLSQIDKLAKDLDKFKEVAGKDLAEIICIPSKKPLDLFYGYYGENCTSSAPHELLNELFTPVRMIVNNEVQGCLHFYKMEYNGKKILGVLGIEPRSNLINHVANKALFDETLRAIIREARRTGYDMVALPTNETMHSNRGEIKVLIAELLRNKKALPMNIEFPTKHNGYHTGEMKVIWYKHWNFFGLID